MTHRDTEGERVRERHTNQAGTLTAPSRVYHDLRTRNERRARVARVIETMRTERESRPTVPPLWWRRASE
jgi:hypothetical protein